MVMEAVGNWWDDVKRQNGPTGFAGNPLFMAGLRGLSASGNGGDWGAAMAEGMQGAHQLRAQHEQRLLQQQQMEMQHAQFEQQKKLQAVQLQGAQAGLHEQQAERARMEQARTMWDTPEMVAQRKALGMPGNMPFGQGWQMFQERSNAKFAQSIKPAAPTTGRYKFDSDLGMMVDTVTGGVQSVAGHEAAGGGRLSRDEFTKAYKPEDYNSAIYQVALATRNPAMLEDPAARKQGPIDPKDAKIVMDKYQKDLAPYELIAEQSMRIMAALGGLDGADEQTALAELTGLVAYTKFLDPTSVAREGEVALTASAAALFDIVQNYIAKPGEGSILGPQQVRDMKTLVAIFAENYAKKYEHTKKSGDAFVKATRMPKELVEGYQINWDFAVGLSKKAGVDFSTLRKEEPGSEPSIPAARRLMQWMKDNPPPNPNKATERAVVTGAPPQMPPPQPQQVPPGLRRLVPGG